MWTFLLFSALAIVINGYHNEPCPKYGCPLAPPIHIPFVPAPPGHTPKCAKPGSTFCESLDKYPQQLIKYLIDQRSVDLENFLRNESPEDFNAYRKRPDYEEYGYDYPKPKVPSELYPQTSSYHVQQTTLHYDTLTNSSRNKYHPSSPNVNPFLSQSSSISTYQSFGYQPSTQLRPQYQNTGFFNPNQNPWQRNPRGVGLGQQQTGNGRTIYRNPLLEFARGRNRSKRQSGLNTVSICPTKSQFVVPRAALNNQGNWMFVVNLEEQVKYSQLVKSEVCMSDTCDGLCSLPLGYTSKCQQQYVQKRLVALEGSGNRLYTDVFWFPHGCMCQVTLDY